MSIIIRQATRSEILVSNVLFAVSPVRILDLKDNGGTHWVFLSMQAGSE